MTQAVSLSIMPDFARSTESKPLDTDPRRNYESEQKSSLNEAIEEEDPCEYIFLIDRSGSMQNSIVLARQALKLFLYSLPVGSKFNIISYGSNHDSLFANSVEYTEETVEKAVQ